MNPREYAAMFEVEDRHWWYRAVRRDVEAALSEFARPGPLLDAGCGTGGLLASLPLERKGESAGVEISTEGLRLARSRGLRRLVRGSAARLPFAGGAFRAIVCIDVLAHRDVDAEQALSEFRRCLGAGGVLVLQLPAFDWLRSAHDEAVWTRRRYRKKEVERLLSRAGFVPRRSFYRNSLLFPFAAARRLLSKRAARGEARSDVGPVAPFWNAAFAGVLRFESALRRAGPRFPFGLSVFCVCEKEYDRAP